MVVSRDVGCIDGKNNSFIVLVEFEFELLSIRRHFPATIVFVKKKLFREFSQTRSRNKSKN